MASEQRRGFGERRPKALRRQAIKPPFGQDISPRHQPLPREPWVPLLDEHKNLSQRLSLLKPSSLKARCPGNWCCCLRSLDYFLGREWTLGQVQRFYGCMQVASCAGVVLFFFFLLPNCCAALELAGGGRLFFVAYVNKFILFAESSCRCRCRRYCTVCLRFMVLPVRRQS